MRNINTKISGSIVLFLFMLLAFKGFGQSTSTMETASTKPMKIRIAEIEIHPEFLEEYRKILLEESRASIQLEPEVISIFPFFRPEAPAFIQLLEIYASEEAYQSHILSDHFQIYKTSTLPMVKSLKLIDMNALDPEAMAEIFKKLLTP